MDSRLRSKPRIPACGTGAATFVRWMDVVRSGTSGAGSRRWCRSGSGWCRSASPTRCSRVTRASRWSRPRRSRCSSSPGARRSARWASSPPGAAASSIVLTTFLLNVRHVLYGLSLGRAIPLTRRQRPVAAFLLTDEAYGVTVASRARTFPFLLGTELSLFVTWNLATLAGSLLGEAVRDPGRARHRPRLPDRVRRAARAARATSCRAGRRGRVRGARLAPRAGAVGGRRDPARRRRRLAARGVADARAGRRPVSAGSTTLRGRSHELLADVRRDGRRDLRFAVRGARAPPGAAPVLAAVPALRADRGLRRARHALGRRLPRRGRDPPAGSRALPARVAWRTRNLGLAIALGMASFWALRAL